MNEINLKNRREKGRLLGIDYGSKRIGLALSDEGGRFALPLTVITNGPETLVEIEKIILDNGVKAVVMGESKDYAGKPNEIMLDIIEFKDKLESKGYRVYLEPEFMTSVQAERLQGKTDLSDASAAALILQSYIDRESRD